MKQLIETLKKSPSISERRKAAIQIGSLKSKEAVSDLISALADHETVAIFAALSLAQIGEAAVSDLIKGLSSPKDEIRGYCAEILGELKSVEAEESLIRLVQEDSSKWVINNAIESLGKIKTKKSESILNQLLSHQDIEISLFAALALKRLKSDSEIGLRLLDRMIEAKASQKEMIAWAVIEICSEKEIPQIIQKRESIADPQLDHLMSQIIQGIRLK